MKQGNWKKSNKLQHTCIRSRNRKQGNKKSVFQKSSGCKIFETKKTCSKMLKMHTHCASGQIIIKPHQNITLRPENIKNKIEI